MTTSNPATSRFLAGLLACAAIAGLLVACSGGSDAADAPDLATPTAEELMLQGGAATVVNEGASAFAQSVPGLSSEDRRRFAVGNSFFNQNWVTAPASADARDGLGPIFNAQSCSSCHFKDGRGQPPADDDDAERGLLIRLSVEDEDGNVVDDPELGGQFQDRSINGVPAEGSISIEITEEPGTYPDGTEYELAAPTYHLLRPDGTEITGVQISPRVAPQMIGVGLLEAIPAETLRSLADPDDADGDGISGRLNLVVDAETGDEVVGRFGWKAGQPTVEAQTAGAFQGDIGVTSSLHGDQPCTAVQAECNEAISGGDPELSDDKLETVTFYSRTLAVPARRDVGHADTTSGQEQFEAIGCASCHTPEVETGPDEIDQLADQVIRPYTDLLLHDMGPGLADDRPEALATGTEWRTPPLWGVGLVENVNRHTRFLHDGRARNLEEAILWHGGEADEARQRFMDLPADDRAAILTFLESL